MASIKESIRKSLKIQEAIKEDNDNPFHELLSKNGYTTRGSKADGWMIYTHPAHKYEQIHVNPSTLAHDFYPSTVTRKYDAPSGKGKGLKSFENKFAALQSSNE